MTTAGQLSIISAARRLDVPVCDVYRAVIDGALPARFPGAAGGVLTVLRDDADRWAKTIRQAQAPEDAKGIDITCDVAEVQPSADDHAVRRWRRDMSPGPGDHSDARRA